MDTNSIIDAGKKNAAISTDMALADRLGVTRGAVSNWRHGSKLPDAVACEKLAVLSGIPLNQVIGIVGEARAISTAEKRVWRKLAAAVFVSIALVPWSAFATHAPTNGISEQASGIGIMRSYKGPSSGP